MASRKSSLAGEDKPKYKRHSRLEPLGGVKHATVSGKYLAEHAARMNQWQEGELRLLVNEQECAVAAVKLERLVKAEKKEDNVGSSNRTSTSPMGSRRTSIHSKKFQNGGTSGSVNSVIALNEAEKRQLGRIMSEKRNWLKGPS